MGADFWPRNRQHQRIEGAMLWQWIFSSSSAIKKTTQRRVFRFNSRRRVVCSLSAASKYTYKYIYIRELNAPATSASVGAATGEWPENEAGCPQSDVRARVYYTAFLGAFLKPFLVSCFPLYPILRYAACVCEWVRTVRELLCVFYKDTRWDFLTRCLFSFCACHGFEQFNLSRRL